MIRYIISTIVSLVIFVGAFYVFFPQFVNFSLWQFDVSLPKGFVYLRSVDSTIVVNSRYSRQENCMGKIWRGYEKPYVILTEQTALALKKAQEKFKKDGYSLVVYDGYRPQDAHEYFVAWMKDEKDQKRKEWYYPRVAKNQLIERGFTADKSSHSRGSAVDVSLIPLEQTIHTPEPHQRRLEDGTMITYLDDGTLDMGTSLDFFDDASDAESPLVNQTYRRRRLYLKRIMETCGFRGIAKEWWHFSLEEEPFPQTYFNFPIR